MFSFLDIGGVGGQQSQRGDILPTSRFWIAGHQILNQVIRSDSRTSDLECQLISFVGMRNARPYKKAKQALKYIFNNGNWNYLITYRSQCPNQYPVSSHAVRRRLKCKKKYKAVNGYRGYLSKQTWNSRTLCSYGDCSSFLMSLLFQILNYKLKESMQIARVIISMFTMWLWLCIG